MKYPKFIWHIYFILVGTFASACYAWQLQPFETNYTATVSGIPIEGQASYQLSKHNKTWKLDTLAHMALVERRESTQFEFHNKIIRPSVYEFHQVGIKPKDMVINFDWNKLFAKGVVKKEDVFFSLKYKMLDPLSSQIALQQDIASGKKSTSYPVIEDNQIETFNFKVLGNETIETPVGKLNTVKVERIRKTGSKRKTYLWFAKDWNYTVVQLYQLEKNGKEYLISLTSGTVNGKPIQGK